MTSMLEYYWNEIYDVVEKINQIADKKFSTPSILRAEPK